MREMGTFDFFIRNSNKFTATFIICGIVNTTQLRKVDPNTRFWLYHDDNNTIISAKFSCEPYKALKQKGKNVEYFKLTGSINHDS